MSLFNFQSRGTNVAIMGGLLALGGGLIAGGCGGPDYTALSDFCVALAQADCSQAVVQACYGSTDATIDDDTTSCINARSELTNCDPGGLEYHAQYADTCISAHQQVYVNAVLQESDVQALQTACLPVFNNNGQQGASCTSDTDCDAGDGYSCIIHQGTPGKCEMPVSVMGGETCTDPAAQCVDTFFCNTGGNCIADPVNGSACDVGVPCSDGLRCVSSVCKPQLGDGAACSSDTDCTGGFCLTTSGVEGAGVCSATYTFSITSASCNAFR
jgi:hypothetical protein